MGGSTSRGATPGDYRQDAIVAEGSARPGEAFEPADHGELRAKNDRHQDARMKAGGDMQSRPEAYDTDPHHVQSAQDMETAVMHHPGSHWDRLDRAKQRIADHGKKCHDCTDDDPSVMPVMYTHVSQRYDS